MLADAAPAVPPAPRVVVLARPVASRSYLAFAAGVFFAGLFAAGWGVASWHIGESRRAERAAPATASPSERSADWSAFEAALEDRLARQRQEFLSMIDRKEPIPAISPAELQTAMTRMERKVDDRRAADIMYVLGELAAAEERSRTQIGQTREALRYVALARDPRVSEQ
jgi:hypothetical protein